MPTTLIEFQLDFAAGIGTTNARRASTSRRPDAVSSDYKTAHSIGPAGISDPSQGAVARVWEARAVSDDSTHHRVIVRRSTGSITAPTAWDADIEVLSFTGLPPLEIDLAFDQNAKPVICIERATGTSGVSETWLRWVHPSLGVRFEKIAVGRTPRLLLDNPYNPESSDVLLFHMTSTAVDAYIQSELFGTVHHLPTTGWADYETHVKSLVLFPATAYLEDVGFGSDNSMQLIVSQHDDVTGRYHLRMLSSPPVPLRSVEGMAVLAHLGSVETSVGVLEVVIASDALDFVGELSSIDTVSVLVATSVLEEMDYLGSLDDVATVLALVEADLELASLDYEAELLTVDATEYVILAPYQPAEGFDVTDTLTSILIGP